MIANIVHFHRIFSTSQHTAVYHYDGFSKEKLKEFTIIFISTWRRRNMPDIVMSHANPLRNCPLKKILIWRCSSPIFLNFQTKHVAIQFEIQQTIMIFHEENHVYFRRKKAHLGSQLPFKCLNLIHLFSAKPVSSSRLPACRTVKFVFLLTS